MLTLFVRARGLVVFALALGACGDRRPEATGTPGSAPATAAADCAALLRQPLGKSSETAACVRALGDAGCRAAVAKAIGDKASRAQVVPAFTACRAAYCGVKVKASSLCDGPGPSRPGEVRGSLGDLLDAAIASDQADVEGKLRGAGFLLESAILATTTIRFAVRTEPDLVISGLGEELRMARPPAGESLEELVNRLKARESDAALADVLIDAPEKTAATPMMDILRALTKAGYDHVVLCTSAGNCR